MAKFGEGDARWIVEKREDGTNVNAWHWQEKDCAAWARRRLGELFDGALLVEAPRITTTGLDSLSGDVFLNNRRAKLVASYELKLVIGWRGTGDDGVEGAGTIELPYLADENEDEDAEVKVAPADESTAAAALRDALLRRGGREAVRKLVGQFVSELKAGAPLKGGKDEDAGAPGQEGGGAAAAGSGAAASSSGAATGAKAAPVAKAGAANGGGKAASSRTRLELERHFYCRAADLFECFTSEGRVRAFTQSPATVEPRPGGSFSWFGGSVGGTFIALEPPRRLEMDWRFNSWGEGVASRVVLTLEEPEPGATVARLLQTGIPEEDAFGNHDVKIQVERGWDEQIFKRIKQVFGFGA
ncbi:MAG: activator of Hsp90 ATPase [Monoraphidium minutum]|nr:MAG: activator of Hsp90 ATPase [Monoraphidium minutum]